MKFSLLDWLIFIITPAVAWILGRKGRQAGTWRGYFLAKGNLSTTGVLSTYFGANLTFTAIFLILSEEAYLRGWWVICIPIYWVTGTLLFVVLYPRLKTYFERGMTLHQALGESFNSPQLQKWASLWTIVAFVGTVALEFYGGIRLLQWTALSLLANLTISLLLVFVVSAITVAGGLRGVSWADRWLDLMSVAAAIVLAYFLIPFFKHGIPHTGIGSGLSPIPSRDNILFVVVAGLLFVPFQFCTLDSWQRLGAWKGRHNTSPAGWLLGSGLALALVYCIPIALGVIVKQQGLPVSSDSHPLKVFLDFIHLTPGLLGLVFAGFISAMFSTADELLNCCSFSFLFDTLQVSNFQTPLNKSEEKKLVLSGQFYTILFALVSALLALLAIHFSRRISDMALAIFASQVVFTFPLIATIFFPLSAAKLGRVATLSMLLSFMAAVATVVIGWILNNKEVSDAAPLISFGIAGFVFLPSLLWVRLRRSR